MRVIQFRGKHSSGWEYGYLVVDEVGVTYIDTGRGLKIEVDPKTVGQFTGLHDKNGKKISEGDILTGFNLPHRKYWLVQWDEDTASFTTPYSIECNEKGIRQYEVIGNIYENPELLK